MQKEKSISPNENSDPLVTEKRERRKRENQQEPSTPVNPHRGEETIAKKLRELNARDELAVAGRVASVHLQNFMCHANLEIDFDTRHNNCFYIGGPNGSGKSALFAAINIGLGGRGSDNDRGNTIKGYIKDGTTSAKISITLTNDGLNKHPDYGDYVIIERTINQTTSSYVLKSVEGFGKSRTETVVSKKKNDVDRLVNRYNIHLSNPAFWMSQDRSRSFLANLKPGNVYKLYIEATNLDSIVSAYTKCASVLSELGTIMDTKKVELDKRTRKLKEMQQVRSIHDKICEDQKDIALFQWNLMFCAIRDAEDNLVLLQNNIDQNAKLFEKNKQNILKNREQRREFMREVDGLDEEVEDLKKEVDLVREECDKVSNAYKDAESVIKKLEEEVGLKDYENKQINLKIKKAKNKIRSIMEKVGKSSIKLKLESYEKDYENWKTERVEMEQSGKHLELQDTAERLTTAHNRLQNDIHDIENKMREEKKKMDSYKDKLQRSKACKVDKINRFGSHMGEIISAIERNKDKFEKLPKGPIGKYISINDKFWSYPIEECIGNLASNFLCHCSRDADALRKIFDGLRLKSNDRPNLIVSRFLERPHSNLMEPDRNFNTVYRMLNFSDPDVHNALIDKSSIETILLLESNHDAMEYMDCDNPPVNASKAYTLDGSQAFAGGLHSQYRFYTGRKGTANGLFGEGGEQIDEHKIKMEIERIQESIKELLGDLEPAKKEAKEALGEKLDVENQLRVFEKRLAEVRRKEIELERKIKDMESEIKNDASQEEIENLNMCIDDLEQRVPEIEREKEELKKKIEEGEKALLPIRKQQDEGNKEKSQLEKEVNQKLEKLADVGRKVTDIDNEYKKFEIMKNTLEASKQALFQDEVKFKQQLEDVENMVNDKKKSLNKPDNAQDPPDLSNFPPTETAEKMYRDKIRRIELAKEGVDHSITMEKVQEFKDSLKHDKMMVNRIYAVVDNLNSILKQRIGMYPMLKKYTEMKVREKFKELLAIRGHFEGDLKIDNDRQTLDVDVRSTKIKDAMDANNIERRRRQEMEEENDTFSDSGNSEDYDDDDDEPRKKKAKTKKSVKRKDIRDLKGLSGGERSFVTAALVMSLWEVMDQPFRMMDEFDVFMDMMNRKIVMDLLVDLATQKFPHNQFIFFTPQGIKELNKADGLQIFEMNKVRD